MREQFNLLCKTDRHLYFAEGETYKAGVSIIPQAGLTVIIDVDYRPYGVAYRSLGMFLDDWEIMPDNHVHNTVAPEDWDEF